MRISIIRETMYSSDPNKRAYPNKCADWNGYLIGYARLLGFY